MVKKKTGIVILVIVGVIVILVGIAAFIFLKPFFTLPEETNVIIPIFNDPNCSREFSPQFDAESYYEGPLFDSHFHLPPTVKHSDAGSEFPVLEKDITLNQIVCQLEEEKVIGAFAFYFPNFWLMMNKSNTMEEVFGKWATEIQMVKKGSPEWMNLFLVPGPLSAEEVGSIYNSHSEVFKGLGEIAYFFPAAPRFSSSPDDEISLGIFKLADENNLIVMVHPSQGQKDKLEKVLQQYPNVKFLIHGWENLGYIWELMERYPNLYFSVDGAVLYPIFGIINGPKGIFLSQFKKNFNSILDRDVTLWKPIIERFPEKFMWGTDKSIDFHYSEEISILYEEFARAFIGKLNPSVQEKFAYKNAENLLHNEF